MFKKSVRTESEIYDSLIAKRDLKYKTTEFQNRFRFQRRPKSSVSVYLLRMAELYPAWKTKKSLVFSQAFKILMCNHCSI